MNLFENISSKGESLKNEANSKLNIKKMIKKSISKTTICNLSSVINCSACFQILRDPVECSQCQNVWCRVCIEMNEQKCPCRCPSPVFGKPHRFLRSFINEIQFTCQDCNALIKYPQYEEHFKDNQCRLQLNNQSKKKMKRSNSYISNDRSFKKRFISRNQESRHEIPGSMKQPIDVDNEIENQRILNSIFSEEEEEENEEENNWAHHSSEEVTQSTWAQLQFAKQQQKKIFQDYNTISDDSEPVEVEVDQTNVKIEKQAPMNEDLLQDKISHAVSGFKRMNFRIFKDGHWEDIDSATDMQLNFQVLKILEDQGKIQNSFGDVTWEEIEGTYGNGLPDLKIKVKNTVFDFGRLEACDVISQVLIPEEGNYQENLEKFQKKNRLKFMPFGTLEEMKAHFRLYVEIGQDKVFFEDSDVGKVLAQFIKDPNSNRQIITNRSMLSLSSMQEFNGSKQRDIKFIINFPRS